MSRARLPLVVVRCPFWPACPSIGISESGALGVGDVGLMIAHHVGVEHPELLGIDRAKARLERMTKAARN